MAEFHKAEFYKGSVFECLSNRLSIEGRPVRLVDDRRAKAELATGETFTADSLPELAKMIIDGAPEFKERRKLAREHWAELRDLDVVDFDFEFPTSTDRLSVQDAKAFLYKKLRSLGFVPMVFNFDKPETKDFTETVRLLCNLSRFVIVDVTNPRSAPLELQATVPDYMVPFAPILQQGEEPFSMFKDLQNKYDWVLDVIRYSSVERLIGVLEDEVVRPAKKK